MQLLYIPLNFQVSLGTPYFQPCATTKQSLVNNYISLNQSILNYWYGNQIYNHQINCIHLSSRFLNLLSIFFQIKGLHIVFILLKLSEPGICSNSFNFSSLVISLFFTHDQLCLDYSFSFVSLPITISGPVFLI